MSTLPPWLREGPRATARELRDRLREEVGRLRTRGKTRWFCIGRNKTGTTSLGAEFARLGFRVAPQHRAEILADRHYLRGEWGPILRYCGSAEVFQDVPFSWPGTYREVDRAFPGSRFLLSVRDDADQWYRSLTRFHAKLFGRDGALPTAEDLRRARYVREGFMATTIRLHGTTEEAPYDPVRMKAHYDAYNAEVVEYFRDRPGDLLVLNVGRKEDYQRFLAFVGRTSDRDGFPWENRT